MTQTKDDHLKEKWVPFHGSPGWFARHRKPLWQRLSGSASPLSSLGRRAAQPMVYSSA